MVNFNEIKDVQEFLDTINGVTHTFVQNNMNRVPAVQLGLDARCGILYVDKNLASIAIETDSIGSLSYYGGFEYIDKEYVTTTGGYTFFSEEASRVSDALEYLLTGEVA
jgi:hypothetical protein